MSFDKYTKTATRLKRMVVELNYFNELNEGVETESESGSLTAIYEGSDGQDVVIRKKLDELFDTDDKDKTSKLLKKILKEAKKAV